MTFVDNLQLLSWNLSPKFIWLNCSFSLLDSCYKYHLWFICSKCWSHLTLAQHSAARQLLWFSVQLMWTFSIPCFVVFSNRFFLSCYSKNVTAAKLFYRCNGQLIPRFLWQGLLWQIFTGYLPICCLYKGAANVEIPAGTRNPNRVPGHLLFCSSFLRFSIYLFSSSVAKQSNKMPSCGR